MLCASGRTMLFDHDHINPRPLRPSSHQTCPVPSSPFVHPPRQQQTPNVIHVCCQSYECGATLQVEIPPSHLDGTGEVLVRCGNCRRLLRVHLPEELFLPGASSCNSLGPSQHSVEPSPAAAELDKTSPAQTAAQPRSSSSSSSSSSQGHRPQLQPHGSQQQQQEQQWDRGRHQEHLEKLIDETASAAVERQRQQLAHIQKSSAGSAAAGISNTVQGMCNFDPLAAVQQQQQPEQQADQGPSGLTRGGTSTAHTGGSMGPPAVRITAAARGPTTAAAAAADRHALMSPFETALSAAIADGWQSLLQAPTHALPQGHRTAAATVATGGASKRPFQQTSGPSDLSPLCSSAARAQHGAACCHEEQLTKRLRMIHSAPPGLQPILARTAGPTPAAAAAAAVASSTASMHPPSYTHVDPAAADAVLSRALEQTWEAICSSTQQQRQRQQQQQQAALPRLELLRVAAAAAASQAQMTQLAAAAAAAADSSGTYPTGRAAPAGADQHGAAAVVSPGMDLLREDTPEPSHPARGVHPSPSATAATAATTAAAPAGAAQHRHGSDASSNSAARLVSSSSNDIAATDAGRFPAAPPTTGSAHRAALGSPNRSLTGPPTQQGGVNSCAMPTHTLPAPPGVSPDSWAQFPDPVKRKVLAQYHQQQLVARLQQHQKHHGHQGLPPPPAAAATATAAGGTAEEFPVPPAVAGMVKAGISTTGPDEPPPAGTTVNPPPPTGLLGAAGGTAEAQQAAQTAAAAGQAATAAGKAAEHPTAKLGPAGTGRSDHHDASASGTAAPAAPAALGATGNSFAAAEPPLRRYNSAPITTGIVGQRQASARSLYSVGVTTHGPEPTPAKQQ